MMSRKTHLLWNLGATIVAVVMLISAAGQLKAYLQSPQPPAATSSAPPPTAAESAAPHGQVSKPAEANPEGESKEESGGATKEIFQWINFLIIAAGFWYLGKKYLVPFLDARSQGIREDMERSRRTLEEASQRLSGIEEKLSRLDEEIGSLRNSALREASAERARIEEMAKTDAHKIAAAAEQEIAAAAKIARQELKVYATELAVGLAEKKIQSSMSAQTEKGIFRSFLGDLSGGDGSGHRKDTGAS